MTPLRVGVLGVGVMGERHARVLSNLARVQLVGVYDPDRERGQRVAAAYESTYIEHTDALLAVADAVTIAAPTHAHADLLERCVAAGRPVLVEKPLAPSVAESERLVRLVEESGLLVQVGHIERFNPAFTELASVTAGLELVGVTIRRLSPADTSNTDVDVIRDLMVHDLDLATALIRQAPRDIVAQGRSVAGGSIDHAVASLSFRPGPVVTLFASRVTQEKVRAIEVVADGAYVQADLLAKSVLVHRRTFDHYVDDAAAATYRRESLIERIHVPSVEPLMLELGHFVDCVREGRQPVVSPRDGLEALRLAEEIAGLVATRNAAAPGEPEHIVAAP